MAWGKKRTMVWVTLRWYGAAFFFFLPIAVSAQSPNAPNAPDHFAGRVVRVDSGDQIGVALDTLTVTVRLHGVDCPTTPPDLRDLAHDYTERRVLDQTVQVQVMGTGPNKTFYGEVTPPSNQSLNQELVRVGLATWARQYAAARTDLGKLQIEAQNAGRGLWDTPPGANVILPTPFPEETTSTAQTPELPVIASPRPLPTPKPIRRSIPPPAPPIPLGLLLLGGLIAFMLIAGPMFVFLRRYAGFPETLIESGTAALPAPAGSHPTQIAPLVPSLIGSASAGLSALLLAPLPILLGMGQFQFTHPALVALVAVPLLFLCGHYAVTWTRREQILRSAPRLKDKGESQQNTLVKIGGRSSVASVDVVYSVVGNIPGLYVKEITSRYEAPPTSTHDNGVLKGSRSKGKHDANCRWVVQHQDTRMVDFFVAGATHAPVRVASEWGEFYPLRVARFYNEIPVEKWFNQAYVGDTRTEVHFIPPLVPITVWGRLRQTVSPISGQEENRVGYDAAHDCLVVVEGDPARLWTRRPLMGLLMTLAGVLLAALVAYCLITPPGKFVL